MIALLQRVSEASVTIKDYSLEDQSLKDSSPKPMLTGSIGAGILALVAVERGDQKAQADRLLERIVAYRIFDDENGRMNLNLLQTGGQLLLVSQFTLAANTNCGNRPSFTPAAEPEIGKKLFDYLLESARAILGEVPSGRFGAHMQVSLINDGPVTFRLRVPPIIKD